MNPYVFIVGCPRSGTTLLRRIADAHPVLAVVHETRWIPRTFEFRRGLTQEGFVTAKFIERMRDPLRLERLEIDERDLERSFGSRPRLPFATFVTELFDLYGERKGKPLVGDKSPGYVRYVPMLHDLWPEAKFVHIIRDGRDVCLSALDWGKGVTSFASFEEDPFTTAGVWWEWYVRLGREGASGLGPDLYHEIRYESLVEDPERESARLCDFLGIPYDASMLRFHDGRTIAKPGLSAKSAWLPVTRGLRDWRMAMDADSVLLFEAAAGDLLDELGYPRGAPSISATQRERAARVRDRFAGQSHSRQRPLPRAWSNAGDGEGALKSSLAEAGSG